MTTIKAFIQRHPVLSYFALVFAISWGVGLIVLGPAGFLGTEPISEAQFILFVVLGPLTGPSVAGILSSGLIYGKAGLHDIRSRLYRWLVGPRWDAVALVTVPLLTTSTNLALS